MAATAARDASDDWKTKTNKKFGQKKFVQKKIIPCFNCSTPLDRSWCPECDGPLHKCAIKDCDWVTADRYVLCREHFNTHCQFCHVEFDADNKCDCVEDDDVEEVTSETSAQTSTATWASLVKSKPPAVKEEEPAPIDFPLLSAAPTAPILSGAWASSSGNNETDTAASLPQVTEPVFDTPAPAPTPLPQETEPVLDTPALPQGTEQVFDAPAQLPQGTEPVLDVPAPAPLPQEPVLAARTPLPTVTEQMPTTPHSFSFASPLAFAMPPPQIPVDGNATALFHMLFQQQQALHRVLEFQQHLLAQTLKPPGQSNFYDQGDDQPDDIQPGGDEDQYYEDDDDAEQPLQKYCSTIGCNRPLCDGWCPACSGPLKTCTRCKEHLTPSDKSLCLQCFRSSPPAAIPTYGLCEYLENNVYVCDQYSHAGRFCPHHYKKILQKAGKKF